MDEKSVISGLFDFIDNRRQRRLAEDWKRTGMSGYPKSAPGRSKEERNIM